MPPQVTILDPSAPPVASATHTPSVLPPDLRGKTIGFIDNTKPNFDLLTQDLSTLLVTEHGAAGVVMHRKRAPSCGATEAMMHDLVQRCDVVITGSGD